MQVIVQVIVLNGGSSSGKTSLARQLQGVLPGAWLTLGVDTFVDALPPALQTSEAGITFAPDGQIEMGETFRRLDLAWSRGVAEMARSGAQVIVDEVFLGGAASQERWRSALQGLDVLWVGVRCDAETAERRERERPDRVPGMARLQAESVHLGVQYDLEVNTAQADTAASAEQIAERVAKA